MQSKIFAVGVLCFGALGHTAEAQTLKACETTADYKIVPPEAGAPAAAAAFEGVWLGTWEGGLCSALIVERVSAAGDVQAWYVYGRYSPWNIPQPGKRQFSGKLVGQKLVFSGARGGIDYVLTAPTALSGLYYSNSGQYKGQFTKQ